jgi:protein tyrosine phosphatase (PTP) superfamily phosphohydrolase (DUF442 family)
MTDDLSSIQNFLQISPSLGTSGQPLLAQFALIAAAGYDAVINLALPTSWDAVADEAEIVSGLGLAHYHIPVEWEAPTRQDLLHFFALMDLLDGQKVFVHCARNMRVSVFVFLYRVLRKGQSPDACRLDMDKIWKPEGVWAEFIKDLSANFANDTNKM